VLEFLGGPRSDRPGWSFYLGKLRLFHFKNIPNHACKDLVLHTPEQFLDPPAKPSLQRTHIYLLQIYRLDQDRGAWQSIKLFGLSLGITRVLTSSSDEAAHEDSLPLPKELHTFHCGD
jgi:hypothetical protein